MLFLQDLRRYSMAVLIAGFGLGGGTQTISQLATSTKPYRIPRWRRRSVSSSGGLREIRILGTSLFCGAGTTASRGSKPSWSSVGPPQRSGLSIPASEPPRRPQSEVL